MNCSLIYCCLLFGLFVNLWLAIECDSFGYDNHDDHDDSISDEDDEFGDDLIDYSTDYSTEHHQPPPVLYPPFKQKKSILTSEKLFDYLNSVQSQVLKNEDVLTIKDRNHHHHNQFKNPDNWKSTATTTTTSTTTTTVKPNILGKQLDFSASPESEIQSDQPFTATDFYNVNYNHNNRNNAVTHRTNPDKYLLLANNINSDSNPIQNPTYSDIPKAWRCQLDARQDCGLVNDQNVGQYFKLKNHNFVDTGHYQWQLWYLMLNSSEMPPNVAGARLITPYFENNKIPTGELYLI